MKYRVIVVDDESQHVAVETDDIWLACMVADNIERYPICQDVFIEKEKEA